MALKTYTKTIGGIVHHFQMTAEDAEREKATEVKAAEPKNKARKPVNKSADDSEA